MSNTIQGLALIGGEAVRGNGAAFQAFDPAKNEAFGPDFHSVDVAQVNQACELANAAFDAFRATSDHERADFLDLIAAQILALGDDLIVRAMAETGLPRVRLEGERGRTMNQLKLFAELLREGSWQDARIDTALPTRTPPRPDLRLRFIGVGPVAVFGASNFPLAFSVAGGDTAAALAAGCSMLVKAPEETPAGPAALIQAFADAGIPPGVLGLVYGNPAEISSYLIPHPVIRKITFTGSTPVGKQLAAMAGQHMKRVTMELGGHAPVIVCEDADIALAVKAAGAAKFRNAGQVCISPTRFLVHESIKNEFAQALAKQAQGLKVGDGLAEGTQMGPLANPRRITAMADLLADAVQQGAKVLTGGERIGNEGNFFQPTVLNDVPLSARIVNEEPFGPVAAIRGFEKIEDAIAEANRLPFGLAGYAFTSSLKNAHLLAQRLEVGMLWINQAAAPAAELPFGGLKDSGYGSEGGPEAIEAHLNTRLVSIMNV